MRIIVLVGVAAILAVQLSGVIPLSSVGGSLVIAVVYLLVGTLAVAIHEAWTARRGVIGWIVNILVAFLGAFIATQVVGTVIVLLLGAIGGVDGSLARNGGPLFTATLVAGMLAAIYGAWGAIKVVNRWR